MLTIDQKSGLASLKFPLPNFFTLARFGNMALKYGADAEENQKRIWKILQKQGLCQEEEIHLVPSEKPGVIITPDPFPEISGPYVVSGNAVITAKEGSVLSLFSADCYPIFVTSQNYSFLALIHGSYVAVKKGRIVEKTIQVIHQQFGVKPEELVVGIGPGIKKCCYHVDLLTIIFKQLIAVPTESIFVAGVCTSCGRDEKGKPLFFSHRRAKVNQEKEGRFGTFVALQKGL